MNSMSMITCSALLIISIILCCHPQVTGGHWSMVEHLHRVSFSAERTPRTEMLAGTKVFLHAMLLLCSDDNQ